jgi:hypothetical protein
VFFLDRILSRELWPPFLPDLNIRSLYVVAKYTDARIRHDVPLSIKLHYPSALWSLRCRINQHILCMCIIYTLECFCVLMDWLLKKYRPLFLYFAAYLDSVNVVYPQLMTVGFLVVSKIQCGSFFDTADFYKSVSVKSLFCLVLFPACHGFFF